ncbi:ATP-grasp domain-containing protein [Pseudomonas sp. ZB1P45]|uniref:ATP-grasp domain-containing protein n=1 Tax=Pseudomonas frigoris TaxID=3398356 RepID=UPI0039EEBDFA
MCIEDFQVEEYISGPIRHFDGLVLNGRILTMLSSQYVGTCLDYMERGHPLGSWHLETSAQMQAWVGAALEAVQIRNGAFHLEAIMDGDEPVFLEVGNRVGGADVVATYELATGIHMPSLELRIHVEGELDIAHLTERQPNLGFGWFVFPGHTHRERIYYGLDGADELRASPFVVQWNELQPGRAAAGARDLFGLRGTPGRHRQDCRTATDPGLDASAVFPSEPRRKPDVRSVTKPNIIKATHQ